MKAGNFASRTATVIGGLALFAVLVFLLPHQRHLAFSVAVIAAAVFGGLEMEGLLRARGVPACRWTGLVGGVLPAVAYLEVRGLVAGGWWAVAAAVILSLGILMTALRIGPSPDLRSPAGDVGSVSLRSPDLRSPDGDLRLAPVLTRTASSFLVLLYPAALLSFVVRLTGLPRASLALALFFCLIFVNDILAYLVGTFLGAGTRLNYPVSPNKSALGFAGGLAGSVAVALVFRAAAPRLLPIGWGWVAVFGVVMGTLVVCGDLVESAFKRSAGVKDSGRVIPGRGGVLDSIDSWLMGAPVFYAVMHSLSWSQGGMRGTFIP